MTYKIIRAHASGGSWQEALDELFVGLGGPPDSGKIELETYYTDSGVRYQATWKA